MSILHKGNRARADAPLLNYSCPNKAGGKRTRKNTLYKHLTTVAL
jgi:hypothetical protein